MSIESVLKKVRDLRSLATSSNQHEAEVAAALADELIQKHRLSEAELSGSAGPRECMGEADTPLDSFGRRLTSWRGQLAINLAEHYGCFVYIHRSGAETHIRIVGHPNDVEIVRHMYSWLVAEIARLALLSEADRRSQGAFRLGASIGISIALKRSLATAEKQHAATHGSGAAIVLASRSAEAEAWAKTAHDIGGRKVSSGAVSDAAAFDRGGRAGAAIHVGHTLAGPTTRALPSAGGHP